MTYSLACSPSGRGVRVYIRNVLSNIHTSHSIQRGRDPVLLASGMKGDVKHVSGV